MTPRREPRDGARVPLLDLHSGYVLRGLDLMPKQGATDAVATAPELPARRRLLRRGPIDDDVVFTAISAEHVRSLRRCGSR